MSEHSVRLTWERAPHQVDPKPYSRDLRMDYGGVEAVAVSASSSLLGKSRNAAPEQLLVGSLSSCHMLSFLAMADFQGYLVEAYEDAATGQLGNSGTGPFVSRIVLRPAVRFAGPKRPDVRVFDGLHEQAHRKSLIAKLIRSEVVVEPAIVSEVEGRVGGAR